MYSGFTTDGIWSSLNENYKLKILFANVEIILIFFLSRIPQSRVEDLLFGYYFKFFSDKYAHYFRLQFEMRVGDTEQSVK